MFSFLAFFFSSHSWSYCADSISVAMYEVGPAGVIEPYRTFREVRSNILRLPGCETGHSPPFPLSRLRMSDTSSWCDG
jgi:hypothetical protein